MSYLIQYFSRSTTNGKEIGWVYAQHCPHISLHVWSYTKDPAEATTFDSYEEAEATLSLKWWTQATPIKLSEAKSLVS